MQREMEVAIASELYERAAEPATRLSYCKASDQ